MGMEIPARDIWAALPFKMKLMLLHVQRAERDAIAGPVAAAAEPQAPVGVKPVAHKRVS
jgi:hypothetical protein